MDMEELSNSSNELAVADDTLESPSRADRRDQQIQRIMEAAKSCFVRYGFQGASMQQICAEVGMSPGALYVRPQQSNEDCMALMANSRVRHLPVLEHGRLVGLISMGDLVKDIISDQQFTIEQL